MKAKNKVVYVPPVYEEVQHEVTSVDDNNVPLRTSFHTDVSLLQRIDNMRVDAQTLREIKESLQPMIDNSNFRSQFEETFGSLTDDELINSCPSRYTQTASEKMSYLKELAETSPRRALRPAARILLALAEDVPNIRYIISCQSLSFFASAALNLFCSCMIL